MEVVAWVAVISYLLSAQAQAYWMSGDSGNPAAAAADTLGQGQTPAATVSAGNTVTIDFARAYTGSGREVTSYRIARYDSPAGGTPAATFTCDWPSATALVCAEAAVADGLWYYADVPLLSGSLWEGPPSARSSAVVVDTQAPFASDIQTANGGAIAGRAEASDTITFTFSEPIDPASILAGWDGSATGAVVRLIDGGCTLILCADDSFVIYNSTNALQLPFGSVDLNRHDYHGGGLLGSKPPITFGASGTASTMVQSGAAITITLGTASATADTSGATSAMVWSPSVVPSDPSGNNMTAATAQETGAADKEF